MLHPVRFRKTRKTEVEAQIELGKLLGLARAGRQPDSDVTVAELLDEYVPVAGWDVSTTEAPSATRPSSWPAKGSSSSVTDGPHKSPGTRPRPATPLGDPPRQPVHAGQ
jgi:hypothetical protein